MSLRQVRRRRAHRLAAIAAVTATALPAACGDAAPTAAAPPATRAGDGAATVPCAAVALPERPPVPAPACTSAAPSPVGGLDLDGVRYGVGTDDEDVLVVDPSCEGRVVVLVRRPDGTVFGFPQRPAGDAPTYAVPLTGPEPDGVLATDAGPCPTPVLATASGARALDLAPIEASRSR